MADRVWGPFLRSLLLVTQHGAPYTMRTVVEDIESIGGSGGAAVVAALPLLTSTFAMATLLWLSLAAFAVLGGADFGAGVWDFFSFGRRAGREQGALIRAIGPIWEANEIWLIFLVTGLFTAFPIVFSTLSVALFVPAALALIGVVLRGAAFIYYSHLTQLRPNAPVRVGVGRAFSLSSIVAPFFFGVVAGAVASGHVQVRNGAALLSSPVSYLTVWLTPFPLVCGAYAVAMCALLAAIYMVVEARNAGNEELVDLFRRRAYRAYLAVAAVGLVAGLLGAVDARGIWANLTGRALPLAFGTAAVGLATVALLALGRYALARIAVAGTVVGILVTWGVAQYPYLVPPNLTLTDSAAPPSVMGPLLISSLVGMALILPSLWFLLYLFKARDQPAPHPSAERYAASLPTAEWVQGAVLRATESERPESAQEGWLAKVAAAIFVAVVVGAAVWLVQRRTGNRSPVGAANRRRMPREPT